jgi:hypothetical protein
MLYSQKFVTRPYPEPQETIPHPHALLLHDQFKYYHTIYASVSQVVSFFNSFLLYYGLDDRGSRVQFQAGAGDFSLHHRVQNDSGAYPASYPMGTRGSFLESKAAVA